ncbi:gamma-butyrobetaine hydroxylase-like domain-containing protein [Polynucleobacter kasalickyi]|uniref:DUF971 family protein n=1 Tax=Polynucleobacter kasalickyi TaxID=1938817 RepID=A0A1W1YPS4_9BURK|nr:DUF971 domain-containing protein [Polynucleobacter kasalickyi]SMC38195.1 DUF971 family protein [Polynucleobacter kasalickyi]
MIKAPVPENLVVHQKSKVLELTYADQNKYLLPFEFLRVHSPSAEVRGHGPGQEVLQTGKRNVSILSLEPVGNYAIKPTFTDGHDSGLFTWEYLLELSQNQEGMWQEYLAKLEAAGVTRDTPMK